MKDLPVTFCVTEITKCIQQNRYFIKDELRRGTTPGRYDILCLMDEAVSVALECWHNLPLFINGNVKYSDDNMYPLIRDTYYIKKDFNGMGEHIILPKLLIMSGFIAVAMNCIKNAEMIFQALRKYRPKTEYPLIGIAYAYISKGDYLAAIDTLRDEALEINPKSDLAKAFLALSYTFLKKHEEMNQLTSEIIKHDEDKNAVAMARALLNEYHLLHNQKKIA